MMNTMMIWVSGLAIAGLAGLGTMRHGSALQARAPQPGNDTLRVDSAAITINLDDAIPLVIPDAPELEPAAFTARDGRSGWAVKIPGGRPIATPAYADGMIFVGGGYGSYDFYAFDARTGKTVWKIHTADDGPSAAVVDDGYVAFNTESCTVIVVEAKTGKLVWQEWLGDPLMSQPAIADGRLFIAHPAGGRGGHHGMGENGAHAVEPQHGGANGIELSHGEVAAGSHRMLCADLRTGRHIWSYPIPADVITAPVVDGDRVLFTCFNGTTFCLDAATGTLIWTKENAGTSAPIVTDREVVLTQRRDLGGKAFEGMARVDRAKGETRDTAMMAAGEAAYLGANQGGGVALRAEHQTLLDGSVGFGAPPAAAKLEAANAHLGVSTVVGGWAYQGSRAAFKSGQIMNAQGRFLNNVTASDGTISWRAEARGRDIVDGAQVFSPPSVGGDYLYLSTAQGHMLAVRQKDGVARFIYQTGHPAAFQPALALGNMYVGTTDGMLICLNTGQSDADGWYAWGGNARHNKKN